MPKPREETKTCNEMTSTNYSIFILLENRSSTNNMKYNSMATGQSRQAILAVWCSILFSFLSWYII